MYVISAIFVQNGTERRPFFFSNSGMRPILPPAVLSSFRKETLNDMKRSAIWYSAPSLAYSYPSEHSLLSLAATLLPISADAFGQIPVRE